MKGTKVNKEKISPYRIDYSLAPTHTKRASVEIQMPKLNTRRGTGAPEIDSKSQKEERGSELASEQQEKERASKGRKRGKAR